MRIVIELPDDTPTSRVVAVVEKLRVALAEFRGWSLSLPDTSFRLGDEGDAEAFRRLR
jgi:hypothetical protein